MARVIALGPSGSVSVMIDCLFHFADPCFVFRLIKSAFLFGAGVRPSCVPRTRCHAGRCGCTE